MTFLFVFVIGFLNSSLTTLLEHWREHCVTYSMDMSNVDTDYICDAWTHAMWTQVTSWQYDQNNTQSQYSSLSIDRYIWLFNLLLSFEYSFHFLKHLHERVNRHDKQSTSMLLSCKVATKPLFPGQFYLGVKSRTMDVLPSMGFMCNKVVSTSFPYDRSTWHRGARNLNFIQPWISAKLI